MNPYPNYSPIPAVINPYQNSYIPPMQNPYMDRMNQLQNYQQSLQQPVQQMQANQPPAALSCVIVDDFNSIVANDVPMDGRGAVFMKRDGSEMQWRNWSPSGTINTTPYKPVLEQKELEQSNIPQMDLTGLNEDVRALREEISERFDRLEKSWGSLGAARGGSKTKKGDVEE